MKWKIRDFETALRQNKMPALLLFYGEDAGLVREYSNKACKSVIEDINDPFLCDRISVEDIAQEASIIIDSAGTLSLGADSKLVKVEGVNSDLGASYTKAITEAVKLCLEAPQNGSTIVIAAPGFDNKSALVKAVEKDKNSTGIVCYSDNSQSIQTLVNTYFKERGVVANSEVVGFLQDNLGNNRDITYRELETLTLYLGDKKEITIDDCLVCISSAPSVSIFKLCDAIGARDSAMVEKYLGKLKEEGEDLTAISTMVLRHLRRLLQAKEMVNSGMTPDMAVSKLSPPVFYGKQDFIRQLNNYPLARLRNVSKRFYNAQLQSRQGHTFSNTVLERVVLSSAF